MKRTLKKVLIRPSKMLIIQDNKELEELRVSISETLKIKQSDIEFTFIEPPIAKPIKTNY